MALDSRETLRLARVFGITPLLAARRRSFSAVRSAPLASPASPPSMAFRTCFTAPRTRVLIWRFRSRRFSSCRARLAADLWLDNRLSSLRWLCCAGASAPDGF